MNVLLARTPLRILIRPDKAMCVLIHGGWSILMCVWFEKMIYLGQMESGNIKWIYSWIFVLFCFYLFILLFVIIILFKLKSRNSIFAFFFPKYNNIEPVSACITRPACRCTGTFVQAKKGCDTQWGQFVDLYLWHVNFMRNWMRKVSNILQCDCDRFIEGYRASKYGV